MGLLDVFRKKKLPPGDPKTQKIGLKLVNKNTEVGTRYEAARDLGKLNSEEAIFCLLQRFTVVIGGPTPDEDEKANVRKLVVRAGSRSIKPIMKFLRTSEVVGQALETLKDVTSQEKYLDCLLELTDSFDPYFSKYPDKKTQTFMEISRYQDARIIEKLKPFLDDDDDDIRIMAVNCIASQNDEENSREMLVEAIVDNNERPRVRLAACEAIVDKGWTTRGFRKQVESILPDQFYMNKKGQILIR